MWLTKQRTCFIKFDSFVFMVFEKLMATDGNHGDEGHELLKITLRVAIGIQAFHQTVHCCLIFHMLSEIKEKAQEKEKSLIHNLLLFILKCLTQNLNSDIKPWLYINNYLSFKTKRSVKKNLKFNR